MKGHFVFAFVVFLALAAVAPASTIGFVSDSTWMVTHSEFGFVGNAQPVCLNDSAPSPCPTEALRYGYSGSGWGANLEAIPGAVWVWAPEITAATAPVEFVSYSFTKNFVLNGTPVGGSILVASDDFTEIIVNNQRVGQIGSTVELALAGLAQSTLTNFDILPYLITGSNTITVFSQNGPFGGCAECSYSFNPAGVVFGGSLTISEVPEPGTITLFAAGIILLSIGGSYRYRKSL